MRKLLIIGLIFCSVNLFAGQAAAVGAGDSQAQRSEQRVQQIKQRAIKLATELSRLEKQLLYPADTHIAIFVAFAEPVSYQLQSLSIEIDGEMITSHVYVSEEISAMKNGGIQKIFEGNVTQGLHELMVNLSALDKQGNVFSRNTIYQMEKLPKSKYLKLNLQPVSPENSIIFIDDY